MIGRIPPDELTVGAFEECDMIDRIKVATGQVNEYNTATFNAYAIITPVSLPAAATTVW